MQPQLQQYSSSVSLFEDLKAQQEIDLCAEDLKPAKLHRLQQELDLYNATGRIVTFNKVLNNWVTWDTVGLYFPPATIESSYLHGLHLTGLNIS